LVDCSKTSQTKNEMKKDENPYHILVIEDNVGDFVLLEDYLSDYLVNFQIINAQSFHDASNILDNGNQNFDLVFLDLSLPDRSGKELVVEIARLVNGIPIVVLTGFADIEFGSLSLGLGATDYLIKDDLSPAVLYKSLIYNIQRVKFISELKESQSKYSDLFQLNPSPIIVYDRKTFQIIDINKAATSTYGYSQEEFLQLSVKDLCPKSEQEEFINLDNDFWQNNSQNNHRVIKHLKKNKELIDVEINPAKVKINNRDACLIMINDITEKLKHIQKVEEQNETLKEIAWIQSHVVRAPLARLMGIVNLIETVELDSKEELTELLSFIKISAEELDKVIRDISEKSEKISENF
jgi:PAS domain S-box-containing protein